MLPADPAMILTFVVIVFTIVLYALERVALEAVALGSVVAFLLIFSVFEPATGGTIGPSELLAGFANPALVTVICLLIVGQGLFQTDALERPAKIIVDATRRRPVLAAAPILIAVAVISGFLNNTPVVVMFLPILSAVAAAQGKSAGRLLMPLSFIAILGGMTTLIGSSTNLLVADVAARTSDLKLGFFSFTGIGVILAAVGSVYVLFVMPYLLKPRRSMADELQVSSGKQFIAQIAINSGHPLEGVTSVAGLFPALKDMTVRLVQRGERPILPPFENVTLMPGDTVIVAATRTALTAALSQRRPLMATDGDDASDTENGAPQQRSLTLAEVVVAPASRISGRTISQSGFHSETHCVVMGVQRRSRMPRMAMTEIRLEPGDVLLVAGTAIDIQRLRKNRDVLLLDWSAAEVPPRRLAPRALAIFAIMVTVSALGLVPIVTASIAATLAMVLSGCLNVRQALRAVDSRIFMLIGASIAAASALEVTGGAKAIADLLVAQLQGQPPMIMLSALFLLVMLLTNLLSNNATAVLFTPIAVNMALQTGLPVEAFVTCVIFAANCSFATPIGYQTNLIVMGPGHYRFSDFLVAGTPLALLLWLTFTFVAPIYYGFAML